MKTMYNNIDIDLWSSEARLHRDACDLQAWQDLCFLWALCLRWHSVDAVIDGTCPVQGNHTADKYRHGDTRRKVRVKRHRDGCAWEFSGLCGISCRTVLFSGCWRAGSSIRQAGSYTR